jgi:diguanylate cyclase (GGDEF)-like protein
MSQLKSTYEHGDSPMKSIAPAVPAMQPEDYRTLLNGVCILNWSALGLALLLELMLRWNAPELWPHWGNFGLVYNLILLEFGGITLVLTLLLRSTDWLDRAPRAALDRLRWLLLSLLVLDGLHLVAFFHVTGGVTGPIALFIPLVIVVVYLSLPSREAHVVNSALLAALALLWLGRNSGFIDAQGLLAPAFVNELAVPSLTMTFAALAAAVGVGAIASQRMQMVGIGLHRGASYDPLTKLFCREVLESRVPGELARIGRAGSSATLMLLEFNNLPQLLPHADYAGFNDVLVRFAATLRAVTREQGDTCCKFDHSTFALLLPTADADAAQVIAERIRHGADAIRAPDNGDHSVQLAIGAAVAERVDSADAQMFLLLAKDALRAAREAGPGHQMVLRTV